MSVTDSLLDLAYNTTYMVVVRSGQFDTYRFRGEVVDVTEWNPVNVDRFVNRRRLGYLPQNFTPKGTSSATVDGISRSFLKTGELFADRAKEEAAARSPQAAPVAVEEAVQEQEDAAPVESELVQREAPKAPAHPAKKAPAKKARSKRSA